ncbi:aldo/keto reductase [Pseudoxanthomonas broegbernensis]|uniref:Aldo/keto reductase n=1 Tax=Pseudoxanthomonas broegbernensis TaxID=83619 RepID=A0A7V8GPR6_9GAMM|nr:aldo/keto reductase [Pseudoxanthomonas broegbernensis]KAF1687908.1 aldo/keto reductase [Pseudoxanthomonas broegbernensis]MBB6064907.1 D-threo-aldose 1-dehydrogenase [Pseudoxanthomonas broegbernensis]
MGVIAKEAAQNGEEGQRASVPAAARVARLGFGGAPIGNLYAPVTEADARAAVQAAWEAGVRHFDTAPFYGYGLSEQRLGRALAGRDLGDLYLSTKVGRRIEDDASAAPGSDGFAVAGRRAVFDYSRDGVLRSFEGSLQRLGVERVGALLLHDIGHDTHGRRHPDVLRQALAEALPAMAELKAAGACTAIGLGVNEEAVCLEVMERFPLDCILLAGRYTVLEQAGSARLLEQALYRGVAVYAAGPYNSGLLADPQRPGDTYDYRPVGAGMLARARQAYDICAGHGLEPGTAALQFPLAHPAVAGVVAGMRSAAEAQCALRRMRVPVPAALWDALRQAGLIAGGVAVPA